MEAEKVAVAVAAAAAADIAAVVEVFMHIMGTFIKQWKSTDPVAVCIYTQQWICIYDGAIFWWYVRYVCLERNRKMGNSSGSMLYMIVALIIIYVVGMGIYQGVKYIQKKREQARDKKFREEK